MRWKKIYYQNKFRSDHAPQKNLFVNMKFYSRFKYKVSRPGQFNRIETWQKDNINLYILIWQSFQEDWKYLLETVN